NDQKPMAPAAIPITAPAKRIGPFSASPADRWETATIRGSISTNVITFTNGQPTPVRILRVAAGGNSFSVTLGALEEGKRYSLSIASNAALKPGQYKQTAILYTDSKETPEIPVEMQINVLPLVVAVPAAVTLPRLSLESDLSKIFLPTVT